MAHPTVFGGATPPPASYPIANSVRCDSVRQTYLKRTQVAGNRKILTISFWHKTTNSSAGSFFLNAGNSYPFSQSSFHGGGGTVTLTNYWSNNGGGVFQTHARYRDPSAWQHFVLVIDTTREDAATRARLWVNGVENTSLDTFSNVYVWGLGADTLWNCENINVWISNCGNNTGFADGYIADFYLIDGQALSADSFGKTDGNGVWVAVKYSGTYGANGCKLEFKDSAALGADTSGNGNHWTVNGFTAADQMADTPTNNYCTLNPLNKNSSYSTLSNGGLVHASNTVGQFGGAFATMPLLESGCYWELKMSTRLNGGCCIAAPSWNPSQNAYPGAAGTSPAGYIVTPASPTGPAGIQWRSTSGAWSSAIGSGLNTGGVLQFAYKAGSLWVGIDGTWQGDPAEGTGALITGIPSGMFPYSSDYYDGGGPSAVTWNFGQSPFTYTPPTGFKALCTANLPAVAIAQPGKHFNAVLYTGNGGTKSVTGLGFMPGFLWGKERNTARSHFLQNEVVGPQSYLYTDGSGTEAFQHINGYVQSFDADGFTLTAGSSSALTVNENSGAYVAWGWKGGGTPVSNTAGSITSQVSANPVAGFSIVTFTTPATSGAYTVGHGLGAVPKLVISRNRNTSPTNWYTYHASASSTPQSALLALNSTDAVSTDTGVWNNTVPTATVFSQSTSVWGTSQPQVAYCFTEIPGYSKFGSYVGNASNDGPFVYCGFRPRWVMIKVASVTTSGWTIHDTSREPYNVMALDLTANSTTVEPYGGADSAIDVTANGFKLRGGAGNDGTTNSVVGTFIYAAFAEHPFGGANVAPSPAR